MSNDHFDEDEAVTRVDVAPLHDELAPRPEPRRRDKATLPAMRRPAPSGVVFKSARVELVTLSADDPRRELEPVEEKRSRAS